MIATDFIKNTDYSNAKSLNSNFINYILISKLYNKNCSVFELIKALNLYLNRNEYISEKEFELYLNIEFDQNEDNYYVLTETTKNKFDLFVQRYNFIDDYLSMSSEDLKIRLNGNSNVDEVIGISVILSSNKKDEVSIKAECYNIFNNVNLYEKLYKSIVDNAEFENAEEFIFNVKNYYNEIPAMPQTTYQKKLFKYYKVKTIHDLLSLDFYRILEIFIENPFLYLSQLKDISPKSYNDVCKKIIFELDKMNETQLAVFKHRIKSAHDDEYLTLQELGDKLAITKERVRQVEAKMYRHLSGIKLDDSTIINLFNYLDINNKKYLNLESFIKIIPDKNIMKYLIIYMNRNNYFSIKANLDNDVVYDASFINTEAILDKLSLEIPNVVSINKYNEFYGLEKSYIEKNYRLTKKNFYLKKGMSESDTYLALLDDLFPEGYRIASDEDFNYLMEKYKEYYETDTPTTKRYVTTKLDRSEEYCLCDRGKYIKYTRLKGLSNELLEKIINYIKESKYTVYYSEILNRFRIELAMENINNQFLLKGLLDHNLTGDYQTNRDSITYGNQVSKLDAIVNYMKSQNGIFSLNDINFEFPDVPYTVIQGVISYESNNKGLLILYDKKFIYADKSNINILKDKLKERIDSLLDFLKSDFITSHKLFANIALSDDNIFEEISFEVDAYNTYSIVRYLYPDEYFYRRPIISKLDKGAITTINAIHDYLIELDSFDNEISSKYITKMNLSFKWIYEYQELCNYMSSEFLQVDKKNMVKIETLNIDSYIVEKIDNILSDLLDRYKEFNISDYKAYFIFPNINGFDWNEYMIIGFINSYFNDKYEFYYKENKYYIRRLDYEL